MKVKKVIATVCALTMAANLLFGATAFATGDSAAGPDAAGSAAPDATAATGAAPGSDPVSFTPLETDANYLNVYSVLVPDSTNVVNYILLEVDANLDGTVTYLLDGSALTPSVVLTDGGTDKYVKLEVPASLSGTTATLTTTGATTPLNQMVAIPAQGVGAPATLYGEKRMNFSEFFHDVTANISDVQPTTTSFATGGTVTVPALFIAQGTRSGNNYPGNISWATSSGQPTVDAVSSATFGDSVHFMPSQGLELNYSGSDVYTPGTGHAATGIKDVQIAVNFDLFANASLLEQAGLGTAQSAAVRGIVEATGAEVITWIDQADVYKAKHLFADGSWGAREATAGSGSVTAHPVPSGTTSSYGGNWTIRQYTVNFDMAASGFAVNNDAWDNYLDYIYGGYVENKTTGVRQPLVFLQNLFSHRAHTNFDISINDQLFPRLALGFPDNYKVVVYAAGFEDFVVDDIPLKDFVNGNAAIEQGATFFVSPSDNSSWFENGELHIQQAANPATVPTTAKLYKGSGATAAEADGGKYSFMEAGGEITLAFDNSFFTGDYQGAYTIRLVPDDSNTASKPLTFTVNKLVDWPTLSVEDGAQNVATANDSATPLTVPQNKTVTLSNADLAKTLLLSGRGAISSIADLTDTSATIVLADVLKRTSSTDPYYIDPATLTAGHTYRVTLATTNYGVETGTHLPNEYTDGYSTALVYYLSIDAAVTGPDLDGKIVNITSALPSGVAIDVENGSMNAGARLISWPSHGLSNQRFVLERQSDGFYIIRSVGSGMVLDISGGAATAWATIIQNPQGTADSQRWKIAEDGSGNYALLSKLDQNYCINVITGVSGANLPLVLQLNSGHTSQLFGIEPVSRPIADGSYRLSSASSGLQLDVSRANLIPAEPAIIWPNHGGNNQRFIFSYEPATGFYTIRVAHSGQYLDVEFNGGAGSRVIQFPGTGGLNQRWIVENDGAGGYIIRSASQGLVLDVSGNLHDLGTNVIVWYPHGGSNQSWAITAS